MKITSYRLRYLAFIANSGIKKKEKRKLERVRVEAITRSGNFVRPTASARHKIVLQRGSFVTTENNEVDEFDRVTAACDWKRSLFRDFVNTIFWGISSTCSLPVFQSYFICDNKYIGIYIDLTQYLPNCNYLVSFICFLVNIKSNKIFFTCISNL